MQVLIVNQEQVRQWLPMHECIEVMAEVLEMLARGQATNPLRQMLWLPDQTGLLGMMPAYLDDAEVMGLKAISVFPGNQETEYDSHQGAVLLFEARHGRLLAILEASEITAIRTAAVSGVATRLLAREEADDLTILGSGVQAATHLEAMRCVRKIHRIRVWSRNFAHAQQFAVRESARLHIEVEPMKTAEEAVADATIICTTTSASDPILKGDWLTPGTHLNAVGACVPFMRELDTAAVARSRLFVDRRESALKEAGDFLIPQKEGVLDTDHIQGEIGQVLHHQVKGRETAEDITLFKSLGLAVQDVASAHHIYKKMVAKKQGKWVDF
ncbi:MAG: ornithine cyclodeaminase family protein [bacterium]